MHFNNNIYLIKTHAGMHTRLIVAHIQLILTGVGYAPKERSYNSTRVSALAAARLRITPTLVFSCVNMEFRRPRVVCFCESKSALIYSYATDITRRVGRRCLTACLECFDQGLRAPIFPKEAITR